MKFKKLTAVLLATVTAASLSVSASAGYIKEGTTPLIDTEVSVKGEFRRENADGTGRAYIYDKNGEIIKGHSIAYLDFSRQNDLGFSMLMYRFDKETGQFTAETYTGFTKNSKGKRYYCKGERITGWFKVGKDWYHFGKDGYADTGKVKIAGTSYTFDENGKWTGKVEKSGICPEDFKLELTASLGGYGFSTEGVLNYGMTWEDGMYSVEVKMSKRDKQAFYSMFMESGMEALNGTKIDEAYLNDILDTDYFDGAPDELMVMGEATPSSIYTVKVTAGGKTTEVKYNEVGDQLIHFDETSNKIYGLTRNLRGYYRNLKEKYPPAQGVEFETYE